MLFIKQISLTITTSFLALASFSQIAKDSLAVKKDSTEKKKTYFKASAGYLTNSVFNGRSDSAATPYLSPAIGYYNRHGFYVTAGLAYLANSESRIDFYSLDAGYDFNIIDNLSGSVSASKSFYNQNSTAISSAIGGNISGNLSYDLDFIEIGVGGGISFATKTDFSANLALSHGFTIGKEGKQWGITPTLTASASTLHFYEGYTSRRIKKANKKGNPTVVSVSSTTNVSNRDASKLTLLDMELSTPIGYDRKKWGISFTPTLAIPRNSIETVTTTVLTQKNGVQRTKTEDSTSDNEMNLKNAFYGELSVYIKL